MASRRHRHRDSTARLPFPFAKITTVRDVPRSVCSPEVPEVIVSPALPARLSASFYSPVISPHQTGAALPWSTF